MTAAGSVRDVVPATAAIPQNRRSTRLVWVDGAREVGIVLVVLGHALGGMIDGGQPPGNWFRPLFLVIYIAHMGLFPISAVTAFRSMCCT